MAQPDLPFVLEMVARSDAGRVRRNNEDAVHVDPASGFAILADGMGGHNAGEVASQMAVAALARELAHVPARPADASGRPTVRETLHAAVARANAAIHRAASSNPDHAGMGTTLVVARFYDHRLAVAHVGDSRLYRWRGESLMRLTRDHSVLQERIDSGLLSPEQARFFPHRNLVTRALGVEATVDVELGEHAIRPGDIYLLCSDGLNDMAEDSEIAAILAATAADLPACAARLVDMANERGGRDNVSVILARVGQTPSGAAAAAGRHASGSDLVRFDVLKEAQDG